MLSFCSLTQGPHSKFLSGEGGGRDLGGWAKEECVDEILGLEGHAWKFSFNFSKMTENASDNDKTINFLPTSSGMLLSGLKIHHHLIRIS